MKAPSTTVRHQEPWNKGKLVGQKLPLKLKDIWAVRVRTQSTRRAAKPDAALTLSRAAFHRLQTGQTTLDKAIEAGQIKVEGRQIPRRLPLPTAGRATGGNAGRRWSRSEWSAAIIISFPPSLATARSCRTAASAARKGGIGPRILRPPG